MEDSECKGGKRARSLLDRYNGRQQGTGTQGRRTNKDNRRFAICCVAAAAVLLAAASQMMVLQAGLCPPHKHAGKTEAVSLRSTRAPLASLANDAALSAVLAGVKTNKTVVDETIMLAVREHGVDRVYLDLFHKAKIMADEDYEKRHERGLMGIVIGPTDGNFDYTLKAIRNGARIRNIMKEHGKENLVKLALVASEEHLTEIFEKCLSQDKNHQLSDSLQEACNILTRENYNGTLFDDIIKSETEPPYKWNDEHTNLDQGSSKFCFLDSDAYPCPGFEALFQFSNTNAGYDKHWQPSFMGGGDLAIGIEQFPETNGVDHQTFWTPGDANVLTDFARFPQRNTGTVLFNFETTRGHHFAHFVPLVAEHVYNNVATPSNKVVNDQWPFVIALYLFKRLDPGFVEHIFPMHTSCRSYPGWEYAGTDGFLNGMFPMQPSGEHCSECSCTPCLVNHCSGYDVKINGFFGWEDDFEMAPTSDPTASPSYEPTTQAPSGSPIAKPTG